MTPYEIDVLLHYFSRADDHPDMEGSPPIWRPTIEQFLEAQLLRRTTEEEQRGARHFRVYQLGDRGEIYCQALILVPLPIKRWIMEWPSNEPQDRPT